jgi:hypothetical protein
MAEADQRTTFGHASRTVSRRSPSLTGSTTVAASQVSSTSTISLTYRGRLVNGFKGTPCDRHLLVRAHCTIKRPRVSMDHHFVRQTMLHRHNDFPSKNPTLAIRLGPMVESRLRWRVEVSRICRNALRALGAWIVPQRLDCVAGHVGLELRNVGFL